ncbi:MAG: hypothetical protein DHS20C01_37340 [marine bacterium B5-7]|nr:MAG: hypothetical protein DHS20C01_37340 [marine bacterium B5-7]
MIDNNDLLKTIVTQYNAKTNLIQSMYTAARERSITLLRMVSMSDPFDREEQFEYFNELGTQFSVARVALSGKDFDEQERILFEHQGELIRDTIPLQMEVIELLNEDDVNAATLTLLHQTIPSQDAVLSQLQAMLDYQQTSANKAFDTATQVVRDTTVFMSILSFAAILLSVSIAFTVTRRLQRDERALRDAHDSLEKRVMERTRELSEAYDELKIHEQQIEKKNRTLETVSNKLSKYLPPQVFASIFSGKQEVRIESERKKLTIFFSDIAGFTETTDKIESEDLTNLINHYLTEMSKVALEYGATIDKYIGDAIMIFFGDPESRGIKEDAKACVKMAIAMQRRMNELAETWRDFGFDTPLACRIGIHTGYCTVGNFGSEDRMDYTIIGGAVNLASRLEQEAATGGILISYETYAQVKDEIACEEAGEIKLRGIAYPVATYRVTTLEKKSIDNEMKFHADLPNLKISVDFRTMSDAERLKSKELLTKLLNSLSEPKTN